jgi:hypothetical protein
LASNNLLIKF